MKILLTLTQWAAMRYPKPPHINTLRRWAKAGMIQPRPIKHGREYRVRQDARYFDTQTGQPATNHLEQSQ